MDVATLVQPLNDANPCGEDMSFSAEFDTIQEARRADDPSLDQGAWVTELKHADWPRVVDICTDLLTTRTKDLRLGVWLTEALAKTDGLRGLTQGYQLLTDLCLNHWDNLYPLAEDGDYDERIGNLEWLLTRSSALIRELPLTRSDKGRFSTIDLESARNLAQAVERAPSEAEALQQNAQLTQTQFDAAREDTPNRFFLESLEQARHAQAALKALQQVVDGYLGADGPGFSAALNTLETLQHTLARFAPAINEVADSGCTSDAGDGESITAAPGQPKGPLTTRTQALEQLRQVADYFRATEPHSPVAYLAEKAAQWGEMSLHQWLRTVVKDDGALSHVEELLGVTQSQETGEAE